MNIKIFCRCSLFPSLSGQGLISTPVFLSARYILISYIFITLRPDTNVTL